MRISLSDGRTTLLSDKYSKERVIINVHIFSRAFARIAGFFWWTVYAASINRWPAINTSVTYLLVFVFPMRTVHTSAKSGATTKSAFTHSNKFLLPSGSCMAGVSSKEKVWNRTVPFINRLPPAASCSTTRRRPGCLRRAIPTVQALLWNRLR